MDTTVLRHVRAVVVVFLLIFCLVGCEESDRANNLNEAIVSFKKDPDQLVKVHATIVARRPEEGTYAFYDAEEPDGRQFVVMTNEKLLIGRHYLLEGHIRKWPPNLRSSRDLFFAERENKQVPWTFIGVAVGVLVCGLLVYRYKYKIRDLWRKKVQPEIPLPEPVVADPTRHEVFELPTDLPEALPHKACLLLHPNSPAKAANQTSFDVSFPDEEDILEYVEYNFGRAADRNANQYILREDYVSRRQHFAIRALSDKTHWIWINPEAGTRVDVRNADGKLQATTTDRYYQLEHNWTITVGKIKLHYSAPADRRPVQS